MCEDCESNNCCDDSLTVPVGPPGPAGDDGADGPGYYATSVSSVSIGAGSKTFTTQSGLAYSAGARARVSNSPSNYVEGVVTSYSGTTLIVNVDTTSGAGTFASWNINLAGNPGTSGAVAITNNVIPRGTGSTITDGTWQYSTNDIIPTTTGSNIGDATHRIATIFMSSTINYGSGSNLIFSENGTEKLRILNTSGNVGVGLTAPTALVHIKAGTATAGTAPIKLTSGTSLTAAEAGAIEFTTDDIFFTITTGAARKRLLMADATAGLTSTRIAYATTNGRLTDSANLTYSGTRLSPRYITLEAGTATAGTAPLVFTSGTNLTAPIAGAMEWNGTNLFITQTSGPTRKTIAYTDDNLWEEGTGADSLKTVNAADATGDNSIAMGLNASSGEEGTIAIGTNATADLFSSIAIGMDANVSIDNGIALGQAAIVSAADSMALGEGAEVSASNSTAIGLAAITTAASANAIGQGARARITQTTNLSGALITRKDNLEGNSGAVINWSSAVATITTSEIDLKTIAATVATITIPSGSRFYVDSMDLIITTLGGTFTGQPSISMGTTAGGTTFLLASIATVGLGALYDRENFDPASLAGNADLTVSVTAAATGSSTIRGRVIFKGVLIENE